MPLHALGFVDNVAELMRAADMLVTKAGGLTLAEAFCCGVPVVVHDVLPGQEAGNLEYVLQPQGGRRTRPTRPTLVRLVARRCATIRRAARRWPNAARDWLGRCGQRRSSRGLLERARGLDAPGAEFGRDREAERDRPCGPSSTTAR